MLETLTVSQLIKKVPGFTNPEDAVPYHNRRIDPVHILTSNFLKVHFNIIYTSVRHLKIILGDRNASIIILLFEMT
jgi:hypothetical protein